MHATQALQNVMSTTFLPKKQEAQSIPLIYTLTATKVMDLMESFVGHMLVNLLLHL